MSTPQNLFLECKGYKKEQTINNENYSSCPNCRSQKFYIFRRRSDGVKCFNNKYCSNHTDKLIPIEDDKCYENVCCKEYLSKENTNEELVDNNHNLQHKCSREVNILYENDKVKGWCWDCFDKAKYFSKSWEKYQGEIMSSFKSNLESSNSEQNLSANPNKTNYRPWILGGMGLVSLVGVGAYFFVRKKKKTESLSKRQNKGENK